MIINLNIFDSISFRQKAAVSLRVFDNYLRYLKLKSRPITPPPLPPYKQTLPVMYFCDVLRVPLFGLLPEYVIDGGLEWGGVVIYMDDFCHQSALTKAKARTKKKRETHLKILINPRTLIYSTS